MYRTEIVLHVTVTPLQFILVFRHFVSHQKSLFKFFIINYN